MRLLATIFLSSGAFLLLCAMVFFVSASKQEGLQAALDIIGPGLGITFFAVFFLIAGTSLWKNCQS